MYLLDKQVFVFMVPQTLIPENIEEEQKQLMAMLQHHTMRVVIFDFSRVQVITTDGMFALMKFLQQLHLLGFDCHVIAIPGHLALAMVDFLSELPFLKFHRSLWDVPHQESRNSLEKYLNSDNMEKTVVSDLDLVNFLLFNARMEEFQSEEGSHSKKEGHKEEVASSLDESFIYVRSRNVTPQNELGGEKKP